MTSHARASSQYSYFYRAREGEAAGRAVESLIKEQQMQSNTLAHFEKLERASEVALLCSVLAHAYVIYKQRTCFLCLVSHFE